MPSNIDLHVSKVTERVLDALCVKNCSDFIPYRLKLHQAFGARSCDWFLRVGLGLDGGDSADVDGADGRGGRKSISCERTFKAMSDRNSMRDMITKLAQNLADDAAEVTVRLKHLNNLKHRLELKSS